MAPRQQVLVGSATGLLLGTSLGLSAAPVVAAFIGGLTALLMTIFTVRQKGESPVLPYIVCSFAIWCVGGVALGIATRTHSWLSPDLADRKAVWFELGYSEERARDLAAYERLGLLLVTDGQQEHFAKIGERSEGSVLHSQEIRRASAGDDMAPSGCGLLRAAVYNDLSAARGGLQAAGGIWKEIVKFVDDNVPEDRKFQALLKAKDTLCAMPDHR